MTSEPVIEAKDIVEDTLVLVADTTDYVGGKFEWLKSPSAKLSLGFLLGAAIGVGVTYAVSTKRLAKKYELIAQQEIAEVKEHYAIVRKEGELGDLAAMAEKYVDVLEDQQYLPLGDEESKPTLAVVAEEAETAEEETKPDAVVRNIFDSEDPDRYFNWQEEMQRREERPDRPYVITEEEFNQSEMDFEQSVLTYYEGDDVLADDQDKPIDDVEMTVGSENLLRFGHGTNDPNIVYIRNERLTLDLEVVKSDGEYVREVHGFIKHSDEGRPRRFRHDD